MVTREGSRPASAEHRLKELGIELPTPPEPFGVYAEAVQTGNLLFFTGMLPTEGHGPKFIGRGGAEIDIESGRKAARLAALNALAVARQHLGSLDKVKRIVRLGVAVATSRDVREQPRVADGAVYADRFARRGHDFVLVARDRARMAELATSPSAGRGVEVEKTSLAAQVPAIGTSDAIRLAIRICPPGERDGKEQL